MNQALVFITSLTLALPACSSRKFYHDVTPGTIVGNPYVKWEEPNRFELAVLKEKPFEFHRYNGEVIRPCPIKTDGGSVPRALWNKTGYSPWTYAPGYLIHDWLYEAHRRDTHAGYSKNGEKLYIKEQHLADWILAEVIRTQMESKQKDKSDPSPGRLKLIYLAVKTFGKKAWNGEPSLVEETPMIASAAQQANAAVNQVVPQVLTDVLGLVKSELSPVPQKPEQIAGSTQPLLDSERQVRSDRGH